MTPIIIIHSGILSRGKTEKIRREVREIARLRDCEVARLRGCEVDPFRSERFANFGFSQKSGEKDREIGLSFLTKLFFNLYFMVYKYF